MPVAFPNLQRLADHRSVGRHATGRDEAGFRRRIHRVPSALQLLALPGLHVDPDLVFAERRLRQKVKVGSNLDAGVLCGKLDASINVDRWRRFFGSDVDPVEVDFAAGIFHPRAALHFVQNAGPVTDKREGLFENDFRLLLLRISASVCSLSFRGCGGSRSLGDRNADSPTSIPGGQPDNHADKAGSKSQTNAAD